MGTGQALGGCTHLAVEGMNHLQALMREHRVARGLHHPHRGLVGWLVDACLPGPLRLRQEGWKVHKGNCPAGYGEQ